MATRSQICWSCPVEHTRYGIRIPLSYGSDSCYCDEYLVVLLPWVWLWSFYVVGLQFIPSDSHSSVSWGSEMFFMCGLGHPLSRFELLKFMLRDVLLNNKMSKSYPGWWSRSVLGCHLSFTMYRVRAPEVGRGTRSYPRPSAPYGRRDWPWSISESWTRGENGLWGRNTKQRALSIWECSSRALFINLGDSL